MVREKTVKPKFFDKLKVGAAAFALVLPLCAGCVKNDSVKPAQQATKPVAAMSQPASHETGKKQPDIGFASSRWVTAGMKLATKDYVITVLELTKYGVILLAESPGHRIMFQVPYGQKFIDAPEVGVFRAEKGGQHNTAKLEIE